MMRSENNMRENIRQTPDLERPRNREATDHLSATPEKSFTQSAAELPDSERSFRDRLRLIAPLAEHIKNHPAYRYAQILAVITSLSTQLAENAAAQQAPGTRIETQASEDIERRKFEGMRAVYHTEVSHLKSLGYELKPSQRFFNFGGFDRTDTAGILSEASTMLQYAVKYKEVYARGEKPADYELSQPTYAAANRLAISNADLPIVKFEPYLSPLDYLALAEEGVGEVQPDLLNKDRKLDLPMTAFESSPDQSGGVSLTIRNWITGDEPEKKVFANKTEATEYLISKHIQSVPVAQSNLDATQSKKKETWNFALYADADRKLTDEQIKAFEQIYDRVQSVQIKYWPEARTADIEMYGQQALAYSPTTQTLTLTKQMLQNANGSGLVLNRKVSMMIFKLKPEYVTLPTGGYLDRTYETDEDGNMLVHVRSRTPEELLNIQPSFAHCFEANCTGRVPFNLDLRKLGLSRVTGVMAQDMKAPIGEFVQHGPFKLFSGYSREVFERNAGKNAPEFARGISVMEQYFGMATGTNVKGIYFSDILAIKPKPNAGVDPQTSGIIDIEDLRDGDFHVGVGRHETVHAVDHKLKVAEDSRFIAVYDRIKKDQPAFFDLISETLFLKDDSNGKELGHAYSNPDELFASFVNGLHASKWQERINEFSDEQRAIYKDVLLTVRTILQEKSNTGLLSKNAPIFADIESKLSKL